MTAPAVFIAGPASWDSIVVLDLAAEPLRLRPLAKASGRPVWVDVHDDDGEAVPVDIVDTNGAGDAFFAGVLAARLTGATLPVSLAAGADSAAKALSSRHLHPRLDAVL